MTPHPEVFGLHANAEITGAQNETSELFATILWMQPRMVGAGVSGTRENTIMNSCMDMLAKLPHEFYVQQVAIDYPSTYGESMNTVLHQVRKPNGVKERIEDPLLWQTPI